MVIPKFVHVRELPEWGDIFSAHVQFVSPKDTQENTYFLELVEQFLQTLVNFSHLTFPDSYDSPLAIERYEGQLYYCHQQKLNDKTRKVLAKTFSPHWANEYIEKVLFDSPVYFQK